MTACEVLTTVSHEGIRLIPLFLYMLISIDLTESVTRLISSFLVRPDVAVNIAYFNTFTKCGGCLKFLTGVYYCFHLFVLLRI